MKVCVAFLAGMLALAIFPARAIENDSVTTYHGDSGRSGHFVVPALSWERARLLRGSDLRRPRRGSSLRSTPLLASYRLR